MHIIIQYYRVFNSNFYLNERSEGYSGKKKRNEYKKTQGMIALIHDRGDDRG